MPLMTPALLFKLKTIIAKHHTAFVANVFGHSTVDAKVLEDLKKQGLIDPNAKSTIEDAYLYGQVVALLEKPEVTKWSSKKVEEFVKKNPIPLTPVEVSAMKSAQLTAATYVTGLGNTIDKETGQLIIEGDHALRAKLQEDIVDATVSGIAARKTVKQIKSDLGHKTQDWTRNLDRIAITEKHNAMQAGVAAGIKKKSGGEARCAIRPMPDACVHCRRLHLGPDGQPRIFKLSQLQPPGFNVKKKPQDWQPCVGAVHPHCHPAGTKVTTTRGLVSIEAVVPGDRVWTHEGRWQSVVQTWASDFEGTMVTLVGAGWELRATEDHELLRADGSWARAKHLHAGDDLRNLGSDIALPVDTQTQDAPSDAAQVRLFADVLYAFSSAGVPVTAIDLDGELFIWEGEVHEEGTLRGVDGEPLVRRESSRAQGFVDEEFVGRLQATGLPVDDTSDLLWGLLRSTYCGVRSTGERGTLRRCESGEAKSLCAAARAWRETESLQPREDGTTSDPVLQGHRLHRFARVEVVLKGDEIEFAPQHLASDRRDNLTAARIVGVSSQAYKGRVYNLDVQDDHSYIANGIASHNCQCQLVRVPNGWGFDEAGTMVPGGEYGVEADTGNEPLSKSLARIILEEQDHLDRLEKAHRITGRMEFHGLIIAIEQDQGDIREWRDRNGETGVTMMYWPYGFIENTKGADGEAIDVYVGPNPNADRVFIVDQRKKLPGGGFGGFDEQKVMLGFSSAAEARQAYLMHYNDEGFLGKMTEMDFDTFREKVEAKQDVVILKSGIARNERETFFITETTDPFTVDITLDDVIQKAGGHKYTTRVWSVDHWVYTYADAQGGKVSAHHTDKDSFALKLPKEKAATLEAFRVSHGLPGKVIIGDTYAILPVTAADAKAAWKAHVQPTAHVTIPTPSPTLAPVDSIAVAAKIAAATEATTQSGEPKHITLSPQFQNFFGDWLHDPKGASKVVDKQGIPEEQFGEKPVVLYHGTAVGGFSSFSKEKDKGGNIFGKGFYFTADKGVATEYTKKDANEALAATTGISRDGAALTHITQAEAAQALAAFGTESNATPNAVWAMHVAKEPDGSVNVTKLLTEFWNPQVPTELREQANKMTFANGVEKVTALGLPPILGKPFNGRVGLERIAAMTSAHAGQRLAESLQTATGGTAIVPEGQVFEVYLSVKKPVDMDALMPEEEFASFAEYTRKAQIPQAQREIEDAEKDVEYKSSAEYVKSSQYYIGHYEEKVAAAKSKLADFLKAKGKKKKVTWEEEMLTNKIDEEQSSLDHYKKAVTKVPEDIEEAKKRLASHKARLAEMQGPPPPGDPVVHGVYLDSLVGMDEFKKLTGHHESEPTSLQDLIALKEHMKPMTYVEKETGKVRKRAPILHVGDQQKNKLTWGDFHWMMSNNHQDQSVKEHFTAWAKSRGYDGLHHTGGWNIGSHEHSVWIAFEPTQIKATSAKNFDTTDADIYKSGGPFIGPKGGKYKDAAHKIPWKAEGSPHTDDGQHMNLDGHPVVVSTQASQKLMREGGGWSTTAHGFSSSAKDWVVTHRDGAILTDPHPTKAAAIAAAKKWITIIEEAAAEKGEVPWFGPSKLNPHKLAKANFPEGGETSEQDFQATGAGALMLQGPARPVNRTDTDGIRYVLTDPGNEQDANKVRKDKEDYLSRDNAGRMSWIYPLEVNPEQMRGETETNADENKEDLERLILQATDVPRFVMDVDLMNPVEPVSLKKARARTGLQKAGPFIGPKGGKWADAEHTIPWQEPGASAAAGGIVEMTRDDAAKAIVDGIRQNARAGWLRNEDRAYKPEIAQSIKGDPKVHSAALNIMHQQAMAHTGKKTSFQEFLDTPVTLYRAGDAPESEAFVSYSFSKDVADTFGKKYKAETKSITLKPRDTLGMINEMAEGEVLVPSQKKDAYPVGAKVKIDGDEWTVAMRKPGSVYLTNGTRKEHIKEADLDDLTKSDLEKAGPHKYTSKTGYAGHWVYTYAEQKGGKVVPHATDPNQIVVKFPKTNMGAHAANSLKGKQDVPAPIIEGSNYYLLSVHKDTLPGMNHKYMGMTSSDVWTEKQEAKAVAGNPVTPPPVPAPVAKPAPKKAPAAKPVAPVAAPKVAVVSDVPAKDKALLKAPAKAGWQLMQGTSVTLAGGKSGTVEGWDYLGRMVVKSEGKRRIAAFDKLTVTNKPPHVPAFQKLAHPNAVREPTAAQKAIVDTVMDMKVGGVSGMTMANWLHDRGHEVYLVGGIVRDLLIGSDPSNPKSTADIVESMNDVDLVSSAPPDTLRRAFDKVKAKAPTTPLDFQQKGCVSNGELDLASLASAGAYDAPTYNADTGESASPSTFDHDLEKDASRRDFTANALYYDVHNKAIIDPTGTGVEDARTKTLRLPPGDEWKKNDKLAMRFWKLRGRGWTADATTTAAMVSMVSKELASKKDGSRARYIAKQIGKNAPSGKASLAGLKQVMEADGAGKAYAAHIAPIESMILAEIKAKKG